MQHGSRELAWALAAAIGISILYGAAVVAWRDVPEASSLVGHGLGVLGFLLMLSTETLYSLRKRSRRSRWGRTATWLRIHIFTGLVGPYMVLLHAAWRYQGLAGAVMLLTVIVVVSGFIGRYIYTAVPRTVDGAIVETATLAAEISAVEAELRATLSALRGEQVAAALSRTVTVGSAPGSSAALIFGRALEGLSERYVWRRAAVGLDKAGRERLAHLARLVQRQRTLKRQMDSLAAARILLGLWHSVHVPLGVALFTAAFVHIGAALYYATLLR